MEKYSKYRTHSEFQTIEIHQKILVLIVQAPYTGRVEKKNTGIFSAHHFPIGLEATVRLAYQPPASSTFLSEQTSHQQPASSTLLSEQTSTSHQPPANRTGCPVIDL
jgi:hypothetical protein